MLMVTPAGLTANGAPLTVAANGTSVLSRKDVAYQSPANESKQGAARREWLALSKDCNAVLAHLRDSLRARLDGGSPVLRSLELATASPALVCLDEQPVQSR